MSEYKLLPIAAALIVMAFVSSSAIGAINTDIRKSHLELETEEADLAVINAAHIIRECLGKEGVIEESILESLRGKSLCEACSKSFRGLCNLNVGVMIKNLEGAGEWRFSYSGDKKKSHEIFVNILHDEGKISVGRLYAEL